jgi:PAS domain S-box-containing protein
VIVAALVGGGCVGLLAAVLSTVSAWYFFSPPYSFQLTEGEVPALVAFAFVGSFIVFIIGSLQTAAITISDDRANAAILEERVQGAEQLRCWYDVFQHIAIGVTATDPESNTIILCNPAFAMMFAIPPDDIFGMSTFDLYAPSEQQRILELTALSDCDGWVEYVANSVRKDGSIFSARVHKTSVRGDHGELRYRIVTWQDVTKPRELEAALNLARRLEAIGQLSAGVAHNFNNLLQKIISNLELREEGAVVPPATSEKVGSTVRLAKQGTALIQQLLSFARKQVLLPHQIDLGSFLEEFRIMLMHTIGPHIETDFVIQPGLSVWVDTSHLRHALFNVVINARDAMPSGGRLHIASAHLTAATREPVEGGLESFAVIRVTDTGTGIAPELLSKVFDPFFSTKGLNGSGLGLSMVHGFAQQSGGALRLNSELGRGTCVELWLPLTPPAPVAAT